MEKIVDKDAVELYKSDMQRYSIIVNRLRSIPDVRDGFKSVHRKILDVMFNHEHLTDHTVKSATIVGSAMKWNYPHGDASVYGAMKPMANWFEIKMPLIKGQGSWGTFQGDPQAAARYTEAKLSQFAIDCVLHDLKECKDIVDWIPTYDGKTVEPEYLPVALPLLLINGAFGIGIGLKCDIPKHNLGEVIDATIAVMDNPNIKITLIPDHCMPVKIINTDFKAISNKGFGNYKARGIIDIEQIGQKIALVIKSTPDMVFLNTIRDKIEDMIAKQKIIQIESMIDASTEEQMRYIIYLKKGANPEYVRDVIYANTDMEKSYCINFEVLEGVDPKRLSYTQYIKKFIQYRIEGKSRLYRNRLQYLNTEIHRRDAYIKVMQSGEIDTVINYIKNQTKADDTWIIEHLIKKLGITDLQASFIIKSPIKYLSKGYLNKYIEEAKNLSAMAEECKFKITHPEAIQAEIKEELKFFKKKYATPRQCEIIDVADANNIPRGEFKIVITNNNFIKKIPTTSNVGNMKNDSAKYVMIGDNAENILIFDDLGKVFKLPIHKIPFTDKNSNGTDIRLIIKNLTSNINTVLYEPILIDAAKRLDKYFIVAITRAGNIKKIDIDDVLTAPPSGIYFMRLDDGDFIKEVTLVPDVLDVLIYSNNKALRIPMTEVPYQKRNTKGLKSMSLKVGEYIDGIDVIRPDATSIVVVTNSGMINKFDPAALQQSVRGKAGSKVIKLSRADSINKIQSATDKDELLIVTCNGDNRIPVSSLTIGSSISTGTKVLPMKNDNIIRCHIIKG